MKNSTEKLWESRYSTYGDRIEGVLQKSFPLTVNEYIHDWMVKEILKGIPKGKREFVVLDLGCGYGRLSEVLLNKFKNCKTVGIDISQRSVGLYNKRLYPRGRARKGDITKLNFRSSTFDLVFIVTTLMYLVDRKSQEKVMKEILRVLRPGGRFVIIERNPVGQSIVTLGRFVEILHGRRNKEIDAVSFSIEQMTKLIKNAGGKLEETMGIPVFTVLLHFLITLAFISPTLARGVFILISPLNKRLRWLLTLSLYISYSGTK